MLQVIYEFGGWLQSHGKCVGHTRKRGFVFQFGLEFIYASFEGGKLSLELVAAVLGCDVIVAGGRDRVISIRLIDVRRYIWPDCLRV